MAKKVILRVDLHRSKRLAQGLPDELCEKLEGRVCPFALTLEQWFRMPDSVPVCTLSDLWHFDKAMPHLQI